MTTSRVPNDRNAFAHGSGGQSPKPRCWQGCFPTAAAPSSRQWQQPWAPRLVAAPLQSLPPRHTASSECPCLLFFRGHQSLDEGPNPAGPHCNYLRLQRLSFQTRSHAEVLGGHELVGGSSAQSTHFAMTTKSHSSNPCSSPFSCPLACPWSP